MAIEKLDETLGVKLSTTLLRKLRGVAEASDTTPSEYVRHLIEQDIAAAYARYLSLHSTFADSE